MPRFLVGASLLANVALQSGPILDPGGSLGPQGTLILLVFDSKQALAAQAARFGKLLDDDGLLDLKVSGQTVVEDPPGTPGSSVGLRQRLGLGPTGPGWALVGRDGRVLALGGNLPEASDLIRILDQAGERHSVALLTDFLQERPDHSEARLDLLKALRPRLQARLLQHPAIAGQDLAPKVDDQVWGHMVRELDQLFQDEAWVGLNLDLGRDLLPEGVPERASPSMKALYLRERPILVAGLRRFPEHPQCWLNLLRIDQALGERSMLRVLESIDWHLVQPAEGALLPYCPLAQCLYREAGRTGAWSQTKEALQLLWRQSAKPRLALLDPANRPVPEAAFSFTGECTTVWTQLLVPLIEAMIRSGSEAEVVPLLGELAECGGRSNLDGRILALPRTLGRPDLALNWRAALQVQPLRKPQNCMLGNDLTVFHHGQTAEIQLEPWRYSHTFHKQGMSVWLQPVPCSWANRLGWRAGLAQWALLDCQGKLLLQGERLPGREELLAAYLTLGQPTALDKASCFVRGHPESLAAQAAETKLRGTIAWAHLSERQHRNDRSAPDGAELAAWQAYFAVLEQLMADPLGTTPESLRRAQVRVPPPENLSKHGAIIGAESLAQRILPRLEADLAHRPSDMGLWRVWLALAAHLDRPLMAMLDTLAPSPLAPPQVWPPDELLAQAADGLMRQSRWSEVVDLLQGRRRARLAMVQPFLGSRNLKEQQCYRPAWPWELTCPLLEALLRLGRTLEAAEILEALAAEGNRLGSDELKTLDGVAKELGQQFWATP